VDELKASGKSFQISKQEVWDAWIKVKGNQGAPGVDGQSIGAFEADLKDNLYKIWNRMSSGTYFPPPVKAVEIPKAHGPGTRILGVPTVADRVAQTVVAMHLEKRVEPVFHPDSYGGSHEHTSFTFLGFTFRPRQARRKDGVQFTSFLPAISKDALKKISAEVRSWRLHRRTGATEAEIARVINPKVRGWMAYYGAFYHTALYPVLHRINTYLLRWIRKKYQKLRTWKKATQAMAEAAVTRPRYFAHWAWAKPAAR
jgi:Group II intron, maturase-specific domain